MKAKRINFGSDGQLIDAIDGRAKIDGLRLEVRPGERMPMLHLVPLRDGKPLPGTIAVPALDVGELAQSIGAMDDELARTPWAQEMNGANQ